MACPRPKDTYIRPYGRVITCLRLPFTKTSSNAKCQARVETDACQLLCLLARNNEEACPNHDAMAMS